MVFNWDNEKNEKLKEKRQISFERVVIAIDLGKIVDIQDHPNKDKYPDQIILFVEIDEYIYVVPAIIKKHEYFLKTIYPSRKYTKMYLNK